MIELLSLLGGGVAGFVFKLIGTMMDNQARLAEMAIKRQGAMDESHDRAAQRDPGGWVRRLIVSALLFAIIGARFVLSLFGISTFVEGTGAQWWNPFSWFEDGWTEIKGFLILDEVRTSLLALVGYYFGASSAKGR